MEPPDLRSGGSRRVEPWPWILTALLVFMIGTSIAFFLIARAHPDPVIHPATRPGVEG